MDFTILTKARVYANEPEGIIIEQQEKLKTFGLMSIYDAIQTLSIKDGANLVKFSNGNIGYVAYYNGKLSSFEIIG